MLKNRDLKEERKHSRKARAIIVSAIRIVLVFVSLFALFNGRKLLFVTSLIAFFVTFLPSIYKLVFKKESSALFDVILIFILFGLLSFWEIQGVYAQNNILAFLMNFARAIAISIAGFTIIYAFFKNTSLEKQILAISLFSFCFAFTLGAMLEIGEQIFDSLFKFSIHNSGLFGTTGDIVVYFFGAVIVSAGGYWSLKQGKTILVSTFLEKLIENNPKIFWIKPEPLMEDNEQRLRELIKCGEGNKVEFKSTLRKNLHTNQIDKQIEHAALKTINAYLNSDGGALLIGISDKGEIIGLGNDEFSSTDQAHRHLMQLVKDGIGAEFIPLVKAEVVSLDGKMLLKVECKKSDKESFLKQGRDEHFYVRQGPLSTALSGSALLNYIENNFRK